MALVESRVARKFEREGPKVVAMEEKVMNMEEKCLKRCQDWWELVKGLKNLVCDQQ